MDDDLDGEADNLAGRLEREVSVDAPTLMTADTREEVTVALFIIERHYHQCVQR